MSDALSLTSAPLDRRTLLETLAALAFLGGSAAAQTAAPAPSKPIFTHDIPDMTLRNWGLTAVEVRYAPGGGSPSHRHPGLTIAYVLEGEYPVEGRRWSGEDVRRRRDVLRNTGRDARRLAQCQHVDASAAARHPARGEGSAADHPGRVTARQALTALTRMGFPA